MASLTHYEAARLFEVSGGIVKMPPAVRKRRAFALRAVRGRDIFEVVRPFHVKTGERFWWDGKPSKADGCALAEVTDKESE